MKYKHPFASEGGAEEELLSLEEQMQLLKKRIKHFKATGVIFWREDLDDNTPLKLRFASLANGSVDIYKSEDDFNNGANPLNDRPLNLAQYHFESDYNNFPKGNKTAQSFLNNAIAGQSEFSLLNIATSNYDLVQASKKYRFFLMPRVLNEIKPIKMTEFMCTDEAAYKKWLHAFRQGCRYVNVCHYVQQPIAILQC